MISHQAAVLSVAFSPDGQTIISGSDDKTVRLWSQWPWPGWLPIACSRISRTYKVDDVARAAVSTCQKEVWSQENSQ